MLAKIAPLFLLIFPALAQDAADRPGLVATVSDKSASIEFIDTKIAGVWPAGQAPRHGISNLSYTITWKGHIKIPREGKYRFLAETLGDAAFLLQDKAIFKIANGGGAAQSEWLQLPSENVPVELILNKTANMPGASIAFSWESEDFAKVTVPATAFFHDEKAETENVKNRQGFEKGSSIFENMRCGSCHERGDATKPLPGPNLKNVGSRLRQEWVFEYLKNPNAQRPGIEMPACFSNDDASAADRADVARYLGSLTSEKAEKTDKHRPNIENGKKLFSFRGCVACHNSPEGDLAPEEVPRAPLFTVGSKYIHTNALADFIQKPLDTHPAGTMPDLRLSREESLDLA
ncbi:MAG: c-type cytochrome, partial [Planctomycetota bacterium]